MTFYLERDPPPGRSPRQVRAVRIETESEAQIHAILEFFSLAWESVQLLNHPTRVKMRAGQRHFTAYEGWWVVSPAIDAYFPMKDADFHKKYEEARPN